MIPLSQYFDVLYGVNLELVHQTPDPQGVNFIARTGKNNGVVAKVKLVPGINPNPANTISVAGGSSSVMESFLQKEPYYSGRDLFYLRPKIELSDKQLLFYCLCLKANKHKFGYGRQANKTLQNLSIPSLEEIPSWIDKISIPDIPSSLPVMNDSRPDLNTNVWKQFTLNEVFEVKKGKRLTKHEQINGSTPYISSSSLNNGVDNYIGNGFTDENCLTFACYGSIGEVFYQREKVWVSDNANALYLKDIVLNPFVAMFLTAVLRLEKYRFSYGVTGKKERLEKSTIKLPSDGWGNPDWRFMENYIKSLPYSSNLVT
ncbi:MAG: restriction endonuclease subunit S [Dehalococcoidales bacterium]|nr:restriction endonuclease subunit S [Dehalococcoidales bacterium]